jgi:hypothetical protein
MMYYLLMPILIFVQTFDGWATLSKLKISQQYDNILNETFDVPVFSEALLAFDGQKVTLEGYVIPLETAKSQKYFVLSRFAYNSCFFCGKAGPETVAEVYTKIPVILKEEKVHVTGILRLNAKDPLHLFYILEEAEVDFID